MFRWAEEGEIQEQRFITPLANISKGGVGLVGEGLATCWRLAPLKEEAGREDPLRLKAREVDRLDTCELNDRWHQYLLAAS
jgi:hypothetical protein